VNFAFLIELAWKSALCAGLTLLVLSLLRGRSAAERSRLAHAGLLVVLLLPLSLLLVPAFDVAAPNPVAAVMAAPVAEPAADAAPAADAQPIAAPGLDADLVAGLLLGVPALLLALTTLLAVFRLHRLRARSNVLVDAVWLSALAAMQSRYGFKHGTALLVSTELASPISWGVMRPVILLDRRAVDKASEAEAVIAHELAHVARLDWAKLLMGRAATALFWFNPLVWILAARCHELREEAADDAVLRSDVARADYAELLIGVARHENRGLLLAANGVAPARGSLKRRVMRVLDPTQSRVPARLGWTIACAAGALLVNAPLAAFTIVGDATERAPATPQPPAVSRAVAEALIRASRDGDVVALRQLLDTGASADAEVRGEGSPLIAAARAGQAEAAVLLLARGADIDRPVQGDGNPLIAAAAAGRLDMVRLLVARGADIETMTASDENALMQASLRGRADVVRYLIAEGADVNSRSGARTPLVMARMGGHPDIERILREAGAGP
jgi:beta-lactamase regulating signal transducer with metallopeptidase domain